jgi:hypothetical protein
MPTAIFDKNERTHSIDEDGRVTWEKDADEVLDFTLDWTNLLDGDTISTSTWEEETGNVTINSSSNTTTSTTVWVTETDGMLKNTVVTAGARTLVRRVRFVAARA